MARATSTAADFVRGLSAELTVHEMAQATKKAGFTLSDKRVWQIRHDEKLGFKGAWAAKKKTVKKVTAREAIAAIPTPPAKKDNNPMTQLRKLALQIGIQRIEELVRELKREAGID